MMWTSDSILIAGGSLTVNDTSPTFLASYDAGKQTWSSFPGSDKLPGPVHVLNAASSDGSQLWVSGTASNGSVYLMKYDGSNWITAGNTLEPGTDIRSLQVFSLTASHFSTPLVDGGQVLMLTGSILIPGFGSASAALFNGTTFEPFALTYTSDNTPGTISRIFCQNQSFFTSNNGNLPLVFVVLIGLGVSLALMLLIVLAGLFHDRLQKQREGRTPAPTSMYDRGSALQRIIQPGELLQGLGRENPGAPQVMLSGGD
jgi:hypothetical protein